MNLTIPRGIVQTRFAIPATSFAVFLAAAAFHILMILLWSSLHIVVVWNSQSTPQIVQISKAI